MLIDSPRSPCQSMFTMRTVPVGLAASWERLVSDQPLAALAAAHSVHRSLAEWQTELVKEAVAGGASWEEIGDALATSRQAAWARFRTALGDTTGGEPMRDRDEVRQRIRELVEANHARLREIEARWRDEHEQLLGHVRQSKDRLAEGRRNHARARREARDRLRREIEVARSEAYSG